MIQFGNGKALLQQIPRKSFNKLCTEWEMDYRVRSLSTWDFTVTHVMSQMLKLPSIREIESVLDVPRSTFSDANKRRPAGFFHELCEMVLRELKGQLGSRKSRRVLKKLFAIDSTECRVHGTMARFKGWRCKYNNPKESKASVKLHAMWNLNDQNIEQYILTPNRTHDKVAAGGFKFKAGATYIFDRAYNEIAFWVKIIHAKAHFVSRLKVYKNTRRDIKKAKRLPKKKVGVLWDGEWKPCKQVRRAKQKLLKKIRFRRIVYRDPESKKTFEFITSDFRCSAQTIADIYRKRWSVELLFRWLKQNMNIRHLPSRNKNSVSIQLSIAVLIQLLLQIYRYKMKYKGSITECLKELRNNLIVTGITAKQVPIFSDS